jgi:hypothetical protein
LTFKPDTLKNGSTIHFGNLKPVLEVEKKAAHEFNFVENNIAYICNAEIKTGNEPSEHKLEEALEILVAHRAGRQI